MIGLVLYPIKIQASRSGCLFICPNEMGVIKFLEFEVDQKFKIIHDFEIIYIKQEVFTWQYV